MRLPLVESVTSAHGTEQVRDVVLVRSTGPAGDEGWGECPVVAQPGYAHLSTDEAWRLLVEDVAPAVLSGRDGSGAPPMVIGAARGAELDRALRSVGAALGERLRSQLDRDGVGRSAPAAVPNALVVGGTGWQDRAGASDVLRVKVKVTPDTVGELAEFRQARPDLWLAADANESFGADADGPEAQEAQEGLRVLDGLGLAYLEQPVGRDDLETCARLRASMVTPIALDEAITSVADLERAIAVGAADLISLKPARVGGVAAAASMAVAIETAGLGWFVGGMFETGIGRSAALALAALAPNSIGADPIPTDLGPSSRYFAADVCTPIGAGDGQLTEVPAGPGIGRSPDPARLAEVAIDRVTLRA